jgi:hypothetical protein
MSRCRCDRRPGSETLARLSGSGEPGLHRAQDRRVRDGPVVERLSVDERDGVDELLLLDEVDRGALGRDDLGTARVVVDDRCTVAVALRDFGLDDRRDLLRRPGGASTASPACRIDREVEHLDADDGLRHDASSFAETRRGPVVPGTGARTRSSVATRALYTPTGIRATNELLPDPVCRDVRGRRCERVGTMVEDSRHVAH